MSGVYYFNCSVDGGRQVEHSNGDPTAPCPICRIAQLEAENAKRLTEKRELAQISTGLYAEVERLEAENTKLKEAALLEDE